MKKLAIGNTKGYKPIKPSLDSMVNILVDGEIYTITLREKRWIHKFYKKLKKQTPGSIMNIKTLNYIKKLEDNIKKTN
jgi:hypothetical protein